MSELSNEDVVALARAVDLNIQEPELTEVGHALNAIIESMAEIDLDGLNAIEPLPINTNVFEDNHES